MTNITIIVAATRDMAIGNRGDLLYHISDDLKRFKSLTMGHPIIMGIIPQRSTPRQTEHRGDPQHKLHSPRHRDRIVG